MLGVALGAGDTAMSGTERNPTHMGLTFCVRTDDKQRPGRSERVLCKETNPVGAGAERG